MGAINDNRRLAVLGRLLLQDLHVAARLLGPRLRAGHPNAAGLGVSLTEADADTYASRFAHTDVLVVGSGPAGLAAALAAGRSGASVTLVDEHRRDRRASLLSEPAIVIDGKPIAGLARRHRRRARRPANVTVMTAHHRDRLLPPELVGLCQRLTDHLERPQPTPRASGCGRWAPKEVVLARARSRSRWSSTATTAPASCWPAPPRPTSSTATASRSATARPSSPPPRPGLGCLRPRRGQGEICVVVDVRATVDPALTDRARALGIETLLGRTVTGTSGRPGQVAPRQPHGERYGRHPARHRLRRGADVRRLDAVPASLRSHTQGRLARDEAAQCYLPGTPQTEAVQIAGSGRGPKTSPPRPRRQRQEPAGSPPATPGTRRQRPQRRRCRLRRSGVRAPGAADRPRSGQPASSTSRTTSPPGHPPRRPRGSMCARSRARVRTLHRQRHGHRPRQDVNINIYSSRRLARSARRRRRSASPLNSPAAYSPTTWHPSPAYHRTRPARLTRRRRSTRGPQRRRRSLRGE